jgi:hypothetical protein
MPYDRFTSVHSDGVQEHEERLSQAVSISGGSIGAFVALETLAVDTWREGHRKRAVVLGAAGLVAAGAAVAFEVFARSDQKQKDFAFLASKQYKR